MNDFHSFEEEHRLSQQFDSQAPAPEREADRAVWERYRQIRSGLQSSRIPDIDQADLRRAMLATAHHPEPAIHNRFVWAVAAAAGIVMFVSLVVFQSRDHSKTVIACQTVEVTTSAEPDWLPSLQKSRLVTIPEKATLTLADHSTLACMPGTRLSIEMEPQRVITLQRGKISLKVQPKNNSNFSVKTPLLDVVVLGTEFDVEILTSSDK